MTYFGRVVGDRGSGSQRDSRATDSDGRQKAALLLEHLVVSAEWRVVFYAQSTVRVIIRTSPQYSSRTRLKRKPKKKAQG